MSFSVTSETEAADDARHAMRRSRFAIAAADLLVGAGKSWLWSALAMQDIKLKYRGSILGPLWITISTAVMVGMMGFLYSKLFNSDIVDYLPFVAIGLVFWQFISSVVIEGCSTFLGVQNIIQQVPLPFSVHAYRSVYRNFLTLAHNVVILPIVYLIFRVPVDWHVLLVIPAIAVLAINGVWASLLFGMVSARFRDVPPIVMSFVQVVFFVTPIFWSPDRLGRWQTIAQLNPFFAAVDIVRAPLLSRSPAPYSWLVILVATALCSAATFALFARFRARIAFWV